MNSHSATLLTLATLFLALPIVSAAEKAPPGEKPPPTAPDARSTEIPLVASAPRGLLTKEELISRLRTELPGGPTDPHCPAVLETLIDEIKQRGVLYFKVVPAEIYRLVRADAKLDLVAAIEHNYDAPCKPEWLLGTWNLLGVGGPVDYKPGEGYVYRQKERAAKSGSLTLNADRTYRWKPGPSEAVITGSWREATPGEMWLQGGAGVVLLDGETGQDWIARRAINRSFKGEYLDVASLDLRFRGGKRRLGRRQ
jgi:hypothetical protein